MIKLERLYSEHSFIASKTWQRLIAVQVYSTGVLTAVQVYSTGVLTAVQVYITGVLTAGHVQGALLLVQGEEGQVHGAGTCDRDPGGAREG